MEHKGVEVQDRSSPIRMKGTGYGIRMLLPEFPSEEDLLDLLQRIPPQAYIFPIGEGVVLDFQSRPCSEDLLVKILQSVVWPRGFKVLAWLSADSRTRERLRNAGLRTDEPSSALSSVAAVSERPETLVLYNSLRSGQNIEARGDVILWGHLHVGAEILAAGSVVVAGRLKGLVHAGSEGREDVYVLAGSFETSQVRVGHRLCYADNSMSWWQKPVLITLEEERVVVRESSFTSGMN